MENVNTKVEWPQMKDAPQPGSGNRPVEEPVRNRELLSWMYGHHIRFYRPNTMVVLATTEFTSAKREIFFKHLASQFEFANGVTTINSMVQQSSKWMSLDEDEESRRQAPLTYDLMRQTLILPKAKERHIVHSEQSRPQSGMRLHEP